MGITLAGRDPRLGPGELAREEGATEGISEAAFETGELALEDGKNEARLLARDARENAIETEEEVREGARKLTDADSLSRLRGSAWVAIQAWNATGLIYASGSSKPKNR
jgi:hypothetical protein